MKKQEKLLKEIAEIWKKYPKLQFCEFIQQANGDELIFHIHINFAANILFPLKLHSLGGNGFLSHTAPSPSGQVIGTGGIGTFLNAGGTGAVVVALWRSWGNRIALGPKGTGFAPDGGRVFFVAFHKL